MDRNLKYNPFRLLGVSGMTPLADLRAAGRRVVHAAKVGLHEDASLEGICGKGDFEQLDANLKSLSADPVATLRFRLMWPAAIGRWHEIDETRGEINLEIEGTPEAAQTNRRRLKSVCQGEWTTESAIWTDFQLSFIYSWIAFEKSETPASLSVALSTLCWTTSSEEFKSRMQALAMTDFDLSEKHATGAVAMATKESAVDLIVRSSNTVIKHFRGNNTKRAGSLLGAILDSPIDDEWEEIGLRPVIDYGHELSGEIDTASGAIESWAPAWVNPIEQQEKRLKFLVKRIGRRHPATGAWKTALTRWTDTLAFAMRDYAIESYNDRNDEEATRNVFAQIDAMEVSPDFKKKLAEDKAQLEKNRAGGIPRIPGFKQIRAAPSTGGCNGVGAHAYNTGRCPINDSFDYTVLYFTVIFVPVFPLAKYLTRDTAAGKSYFGTVPWSPGMFVHLAASVIAILWLIANLAGGAAGMDDGYESTYGGTRPQMNSPPQRTYPPASRSAQNSIGGRTMGSSPETSSQITEAPEPEKELPLIHTVRPANGENILSPKSPSGSLELGVENKVAGYDAALILVNVNKTDVAYRFFYVRFNDSVEISDIAAGEYELLIRYGIDWNQAELKFNHLESLSRLVDPLVFELTKISENDEVVYYDGWSLELQTKAGDGAFRRTVSYDDFPKK